MTFPSSVDGKGGVRQVVDDVGHPLPGFLQLVLCAPAFYREPDLMLQFYELRPGIATLLEVEIDTIVHRLDDHFLASPAGEEDERDQVVLFSQCFKKIEAVHVRHLVIGDNAVNGRLFHCPHALFCREGGLYGDGTRHLEECFSHFQQCRLIIDIENTIHGRSP